MSINAPLNVNPDVVSESWLPGSNALFEGQDVTSWFWVMAIGLLFLAGVVSAYPLCRLLARSGDVKEEKSHAKSEMACDENARHAWQKIVNEVAALARRQHQERQAGQLSAIMLRHDVTRIAQESLPAGEDLISADLPEHERDDPVALTRAKYEYSWTRAAADQGRLVFVINDHYTIGSGASSYAYRDSAQRDALWVRRDAQGDYHECVVVEKSSAKRDELSRQLSRRLLGSSRSGAWDCSGVIDFGWCGGGNREGLSDYLVYGQAELAQSQDASHRRRSASLIGSGGMFGGGAKAESSSPTLRALSAAGDDKSPVVRQPLSIERSRCPTPHEKENGSVLPFAKSSTLRVSGTRFFSAVRTPSPEALQEKARQTKRAFQGAAEQLRREGSRVSSLLGVR